MEETTLPEFFEKLAQEEYDEVAVAQRTVDLLLPAAENDPDNVDMLTVLAEALVTLKREEEAMEIYCRILFIEPYRADARFNLGALCLNKVRPRNLVESDF
jgi:Tfp pilus assembly protein PilF